MSTTAMNVSNAHTAGGVHPVDEVIAAPKLFALGLQHVLVMYAGAIAVPLILGRALKLSPETVALLINADLLACGIVTIIQSLGIGPIGIRMPVMMGVTFAAVGPMLAIANDATILGAVPPGATQAVIDAANGNERLLTIFGSAIAAGLFALMISPILSFLLPLFPPIVTGSIILMIGISLMRVGVGWAAGAPAANLPGYGDPFNLGVAALVMLIILMITRFVKGFFGNIAVLLGIVIGCLLCYFVWGTMSMKKVIDADAFALIYPFQFGIPRFNIAHIITMCIVMVVVLIESAGMFLALSDMMARN